MTLLLDVVLRSSVILAATMVVLPFLRRRSAALRHGVLAGAMAASAVVVPLSWTVPAWTVEVPAAVTVSVSDTAALPVLPETTPVEVTASAGRVAPATLLAALWAVGVALGVGLMAVSFFRLHRIVARAVAVVDGPWKSRRRRPGGLGRPSSPDHPVADRHAGPAGDVGRDQAADPASVARDRVEPDADPRGARSRNRPHPAPGLARAVRRRRAAGDLLVQSALLACVSPAAARKRTGLR